VFEERSDEIFQQKKSKSCQNFATNAGKVEYVVMYDSIHGIIRGLDCMFVWLNSRGDIGGNGEIEGLTRESRRARLV
jgi:hypothetical protein